MPGREALPGSRQGQRCRIATRPRSPEAQQEPSGARLRALYALEFLQLRLEFLEHGHVHVAVAFDEEEQEIERTFKLGKFNLVTCRIHTCFLNKKNQGNNNTGFKNII